MNRFDFLEDSILGRQGARNTKYQHVPESKLKQELEVYRELCLEEFQRAVETAAQSPDEPKIFDPKKLGLSTLRSLVLYADTVVTEDPLAKETAPESEFNETFMKYLATEKGYSNFAKPKREEYRRQAIAKAVGYIFEVRPLVESGFLQLLPLSILNETPTEIPLTYSESAFWDALPEKVMQRFHEAAIVRTVRQGFVLSRLEPCRDIQVSFDGCPGFHHGWQLMDVEWGEIRDDNTSTFRTELPDTAPDPVRFRHWVRQSVSQSARHAFEKLVDHLIMADRCNASYVTESPLYAELLGIPQNAETEILNSVLEVDVPYFHGAPLDQIAKLRESASDSLRAFRADLAQKVSGLGEIADSATRRVEAEKIARDYREHRVPQLNKKLEDVERKYKLFGLLGAVGTLATVSAFVPPMETVLGLLASIGCFTAKYDVDKRPLRRDPAYFLLQLKKQNK